MHLCLTILSHLSEHLGKTAELSERFVLFLLKDSLLASGAGVAEEFDVVDLELILQLD